MPEDKKNQQKGKSEAKEQRKPRQARQKPGPARAPAMAHVGQKSVETKGDIVAQKPVYEDPGPDFYKNLKRETDEIVKISDETNSKYKKKEIQSNWTKYEMPIESYETIEEHEKMGADYEQLIQMPLSVGGHFQFKHEKSWDVSTGPSPYDKYFEINMNNLATALCTIPFYERNSIGNNIFSESEILTMTNRAIKYKHKYYTDKSYTTPELEATDKILSKLSSKTEPSNTDSHTVNLIDNVEDIVDVTPEVQSVKENDQIEFQLKNKVKEIMKNIDEKRNDTQIDEAQKMVEIDDLVIEEELDAPAVEMEETPSDETDVMVSVNEPTEKGSKTDILKKEELKNQVIESPEDLEKWLDDFLDG